MKKRKVIGLVTLTFALVIGLAGCTGSSSSSSENGVDLSEEEEILDATEDTSEGIVVLGEPLEGVLPFVDGFDGVILVPLFPIAEKLGIETHWNEEEQKATVGGDIFIWVGADYYVKGEGEPVTFGPAPQLIEDVLYVPMYFFSTVVEGYEAFIADGAVNIQPAGE